MLAEEYGYQLSPQAAEELTPDLSPEVARGLAAAEETRKFHKTCGTSCAGVLLFFGILFGLGEGDNWSIPVVGSLFIGAIAFTLITNKPDAEHSELKQIAASVQGARWQVWPCRVEAESQESLKKLLLLAPDRSVAREFRCVLPEDVWLGMTDGRGLVWFVGDMRFGGLVALPGGSPLWWARVPKVTSPPPPSTGVERQIEEELTRRAINFAFDQWLPG